MHPTLPAFLTVALLTAYAAAQKIIPSPTPPQRNLPAVSLLPQGSTLSGVMMPRYNAERKLQSVLRARGMRITEESTIEGDHVSIDVYRPDGSRRGRVELGQATFDQKREIISANQEVRISSEDLTAIGSGAILHLNSSQGFLLGPVQSRFYPASDSTSMITPLPGRRFPQQARWTAAVAVALQLPLAAIPPPLTDQELSGLDQAAAPAGDAAAANLAETENTLTRSTDAAASAAIMVESFLQAAGLASLLADPATTPAPAPEIPDLKARPEDTVVNCDGGLYFDGEEGLLVYLTNVRLRNPQFNLECKDQLKVFLELKEEPKKTAGDKPKDDGDKKAQAKKAKDKDAADSLFSSGRFGDVSKIVASGGVKVTQKDAKGQPVIATAETAHYDVKSGDVILRGGFPSLRQGRSGVVAKEPGLYIRLFKNGNIYTQPGKWDTLLADLPNQGKLKP